MTTNGLVLSEKLDSLIDAGLTSVNISLGMCTCMYSWECMYVMRNCSAYLCIHHRFDRIVDEK